MSQALDQLPWMQPLLLVVLVIVGLGLRRGGKGRAPAIGLAVLWLAVVIAMAWFAWSLTQALSMLQVG